MKHKLLRVLVALVLVCCMIFNCIAIKAEASVLGAAAVLFGDDAALAVIAACLAGLGVMANLESETDTLAFRHLCQDAYDAMVGAGEWVVDGALTVYNCATELWDYGVDCGMVQWLHDWMFQSSVLQTSYNSISATHACNSYADALAYAQHCKRAYRSVSDNGDVSIIVTSNSPYVTLADGTLTINMTKTGFSIYDGGDKWKFISSVGYAYYYNVVEIATSPLITSDYVLGTVAPAGTDIQTEYGEYIVIVAPNGVPDTGGDGNGDDQPRIPIIPVPVLPSYEETIQLPQEDIWKGNKVETEEPDTGDSSDPSTDTDGSLVNTPWESFKKWISEGWKSIIQAIPTPDSIAEAVGNVIKSIFVPHADFITEKWNDIRSRFEFADSITATGEVLVNILDGLDPEPPVIYIDLGAAEGSYDIGGEVPFVDLRWYARYKPTMDLIISAFLWLAFVWRLLLKLPGIISGMPGEFVLMNLPVNLPHLGIGSAQRREELESGRNNRRLGDGH